MTDASCDVLNAFPQLDLLEVGIAFALIGFEGDRFDKLHSPIKVTGGRSTGDGVTCAKDSAALQKVRSEFPVRAEAFVNETGFWSFQVEPLEAFHLELIAGCEKFDILAFYSFVPDEQLAYLPTFPNLTHLTFYATPVSAGFLEHAAKCPALEELSLFDTPVTDDQLGALAESTT